MEGFNHVARWDKEEVTKGLDYGNKDTAQRINGQPTMNPSLVGLWKETGDTSPFLWKPNNFEILSGHPVKREG